MKSSRLTSSLLSRWPHFFGNTWSSMWIAATPALSNSWTVRKTFNSLPKPVSLSLISGTSIDLAIRLALPTISLIVIRP